MTSTRDYSKGKIYKIEPICEHDEGDIYSGSTTQQYLSQRMIKHKSSYKHWKIGDNKRYMASCDLFEKYNIENCKIILIETYPCNSNDELLQRETHYIQSMKCLNKRVSHCTRQEYYQKHKEKLIEKTKEYYIQNKEKVKEMNKKYREENKETLNSKKRENKITCLCGCTVRMDGLTNHQRSKKHINLMNAKSSETTN